MLFRSHFKFVRIGVIEAEERDQVIGEVGEAAADDGHPVSQTPKGPHEGPRSGRQGHPTDRCLNGRFGRSGQQGHPGMQGFGEIHGSGHRLFCEFGDLLPAAGLVGEEVKTSVEDARDNYKKQSQALRRRSGLLEKLAGSFTYAQARQFVEFMVTDHTGQAQIGRAHV